MNVSQLSRYRALVPSLRKIGDGRYSLFWRIRNLVETERRAIAMHLVPVAMGDKSHSDDNTSGLKWAYFRHVHPRIVEAWLTVNGWERADVDSSHDCSGQLFARSPWIRQTGNRVLVTQSWGYDI